MKRADLLFTTDEAIELRDVKNRSTANTTRTVRPSKATSIRDNRACLFRERTPRFRSGVPTAVG